MTEDWLLRAEAICMQCSGQCCHEALPPVSESCYHRLIAEGVPHDHFERNGYRRIRAKADGTCICRQDGKCSIHGVKPETCRAGPFTFDVRGEVIEIFLKSESICPLVGLLKGVPVAWNQQYSVAVKSISFLVANLPDEELALICSIDEPDTEKVAEIPRRRAEIP